MVWKNLVTLDKLYRTPDHTSLKINKSRSLGKIGTNGISTCTELAQYALFMFHRTVLLEDPGVSVGGVVDESGINAIISDCACI